MSMCCVRNVDCSKGLSCDQKIIELDRTRAANDPLVFTITEKASTRHKRHNGVGLGVEAFSVILNLPRWFV